jgi:hypothetical protein
MMRRMSCPDCDRPAAPWHQREWYDACRVARLRFVLQRSPRNPTADTFACGPRLSATRSVASRCRDCAGTEFGNFGRIAPIRLAEPCQSNQKSEGAPRQRNSTAKDPRANIPLRACPLSRQKVGTSRYNLFERREIVMSSPDEISKLRDELRVLDGTIQAERNEEIRHALQRGRLEAERAQLLVKIMEAVGGAAPTPLQATPYRVVVQQRGSIPVVEVPPAPPTVPERRRLRPHGIPCMPDMILGVLKDALKGLVARQIIDAIRQRWWPEAPPNRVYTALVELRKSGRTQRYGDSMRWPSIAALTAQTAMLRRRHAYSGLSRQAEIERAERRLLALRLVEAGYRALAKQLHPDHGGR